MPVITPKILNGGYTRDPYLTSGIVFVPIMPTLLVLNLDQKGVLWVEKQIFGLFWA